MKLIAEGLKHNNTLLGLHLLGNQGEIDAKGHVHASDASDINDVAQTHIYTRMPASLRTGTVNNKFLLELQAC
jgi:hypothetical protein